MSLRICAHGSSSVLAILGGVLFLVLPVSFLIGTVSIFRAIGFEGQCTSGVCRGWVFPIRDDIVLYLIFLGTICIILGLLALRLDLRPRTGIALGSSVGVAFLLGLISLLSGMATSRIQETFITNPQAFLIFPDLSVVLMVGASVVFIYELLRARLSLPLTAAEASTNKIRSE